MVVGPLDVAGSPSAEAALKVVVWGASRSGRSTVLRHLAAAAMRRGPVTCGLLEANVASCDLRLPSGRFARVVDLEGEPGETSAASALAGASAILFVADSHARRLGANRSAAVSLLRAGSPPHVILCVHKRDLPTALEVEAVARELAPLGASQVVESLEPGGRRAEKLLDAVVRALEGAAAQAVAG